MPKPWQNLLGRFATRREAGHVLRHVDQRLARDGEHLLAARRGIEVGLGLREGRAALVGVQRVADAQLEDLIDRIAFRRSRPQMWPVSWQAIAASKSTVNGVPAIAAWICGSNCLNQRMSAAFGMFFFAGNRC